MPLTAPQYNPCRELTLAPGTGRTLTFAKGPLIMGILNTTPDSFFPDSRVPELESALAKAAAMEKEGAQILDIGGESTRPGARELTPEEESDRVIPLIKALRARTDLVLSVDTRHGLTARLAMEAGADWINDVSAFEDDPQTVKAALNFGACVVLMHRQGSAPTMQKNPHYGDVVSEVKSYLKARGEFAQDQGILTNRIILDPGIGFGKTLDHNLALIKHLPELCALGYPLLLGLSRKSFIQGITGAPVDQRLPGSLASGLAAVMAGASILRVHDVAQTAQALDVFQRILEARPC